MKPHLPKNRVNLGLRLLTLILSVFCFTSVSVAHPEEEHTLRFSAIPDQNSTELREKFNALASSLAKELGIKVKYVPARDYQAAVELFKNGDIELAWFGGLTGVQARIAVPGALAIAQGDSDPKYYSYFIAHKDVPLEKSEAFPMELGKYSFTFGSESSTSGRLMPEFFIRKETGKSPKDFFASAVGFSGSHDKTVELVASGQYQTGAVNYKVYDRRIAKGETDAKNVKIIWKTPFYADYNWTAHPVINKKFGADFIQEVQAALIGIKDKEILSAFPRDAMIPAVNKDFEGIEKVAKELNMIR
jgi:phosphonate transport system substrate-binding protein